MLRVYSDQSLLKPGERHEIIFYPFWGKNHEDPIDPTSGRFDQYQRLGKEHITLVSLPESDAAVLPYQWRGLDETTLGFIAKATNAGKRIITFFNHDSTEEIPIDNGIIFRTSFYESRRKPNEFAMPAWSEDFVERYFNGDLPVRGKSPKPVVSYCGYAANWKFRLMKLLNVRGLHPGMLIRTTAIDTLEQSSHVTTTFVLRSDFWAGVHKAKGKFDPEEIRRARREFVDNMAAGEYVICARGAGNFSYRLYETLSLGRIPVFINTDCVLPYSNTIPWRKICVWVEASELPQIDRKIVEFHDRHTALSFIALQRQCREVWEEYLSPQGFFRNIHSLLVS